MKSILFSIPFLLILACSPEPQTPSTIISRTLIQTSKSWNGSPLPAYPRGVPEISILRITIPAGARLPLHTHPCINAGILLKGQLTVTTKQKKVLHLKAGDPIVEVVDTWHEGINPGKVPAIIVVFYAGTKGKAITIKK